MYTGYYLLSQRHRKVQIAFVDARTDEEAQRFFEDLCADKGWTLIQLQAPDSTMLYDRGERVQEGGAA